MGDDDFGAKAAALAHARIHPGDGAQLFPQAKLGAERLNGGKAAINGVVSVGDKLQTHPGRLLGDRRHI